MEQALLKADLIARFEQKYGAFSALLWALNEDEINKQPAYGGWTPGQVTDHVIKATGGIPDTHTRETERPFDEKVDGLAKLFLNFDIKMQAPDFIIPGNGPFNKAALLEELDRIKNRHIGEVTNKDPFALCLDMEMPKEGFMTRYEWWSFLLFHLERHTYQLRNIYKSFHGE